MRPCQTRGRIDCQLITVVKGAPGSGGVTGNRSGTTGSTIARQALPAVGTELRSDWKKGSPITWEGLWEGKYYKDKGTIQDIERGYLLRYTHFSPLSGMPDRPENYHTVTIELADSGEGTEVTLTQDHNTSEEARVHSEKNWGTMLSMLKQYLEES